MLSNIVPQITVTAQQKDTHVVYICNETGQPYANLAQLEKMFPNTSRKQLQYRLKVVQNDLVKMAKVQTPGGLQGGILYPASVVFDLAFEFDLGLAKQMGSAGAAVYLYGLAGYQVKPQVPDETNLAEWLKARAEGKVNRLSLTDQIKVFVQYATERGSSNPDYYYIHISNLVNKYIIEDYTKVSAVKNKRDRMSKDQLRHVAVMEEVFIKLIQDQMVAGAGYKYIYSELKARAAAIAAVLDLQPKPLSAKSNKKLFEAQFKAELQKLIK